MTIHQLQYFRDENQGVYRSHPLEVIRATTIAAAGNPYVDSHDRIGNERVVYYNDPTAPHGQETRLVLRMVQHTGGAWNKGAAESVTGGPTEGRLLHDTGTMAAQANAPVSTLQGVLFADYYDLHQNRIQNARVVTDQQNGDQYWVIVEGAIECLSGAAAITADTLIMSAGDAEGGSVARTVAWDAAGAATNVYMTPQIAIGISTETVAEDALAVCYLDIREFGFRLL